VATSCSFSADRSHVRLIGGNVKKYIGNRSAFGRQIIRVDFERYATRYKPRSITLVLCPCCHASVFSDKSVREFAPKLPEPYANKITIVITFIPSSLVLLSVHVKASRRSKSRRIHRNGPNVVNFGRKTNRRSISRAIIPLQALSIYSNRSYDGCTISSLVHGDGDLAVFFVCPK